MSKKVSTKVVPLIKVSIRNGVESILPLAWFSSFSFGGLVRSSPCTSSLYPRARLCARVVSFPTQSRSLLLSRAILLKRPVTTVSRPGETRNLPSSLGGASSCRSAHTFLLPRGFGWRSEDRGGFVRWREQSSVPCHERRMSS